MKQYDNLDVKAMSTALHRLLASAFGAIRDDLPSSPVADTDVSPD